jgi:hypothetical protein
VIVALALLAAAPPAGAAADPALRCGTAKLAAAIVETRALLRCEQTGAGVACAAPAESRRDAAFDRAEARGGCATTGDSAVVGDQTAGLAEAIALNLQVGGPAPSRCARRQFVAAGQALGRLGRVYARNERADDPVRLAAALATAQSRFDTAYGRAVAQADCLATTTAAQAWAVIIGNLPNIVAALFPDPSPPVTCPCWTSADIDTLFPPGYFDGRGGAECSSSGTSGSIGAGDTCDIFGPAGIHYWFRRGQASVSGSICVVTNDLDLDDDGTCNYAPLITSVTPEEVTACVAELLASQAYRDACP